MKSLLGAPMPRRARKGDAGYDMYLPDDLTIKKGQRPVIDTGIAMEDGDIPEGYVAMIFPRSSMGLNYGLAMANSVPIIDQGYRDTIKLKLWLNDPSVELLKLKKWDRICQMVLIPFGTIASEIPPEEERDGGLGSTGN